MLWAGMELDSSENRPRGDFVFDGNGLLLFAKLSEKRNAYFNSR